MKLWILIAISGGVVAAGIGLGELVRGAQDSKSVQNFVESASAQALPATSEQPTESFHEEEVFVPVMPPDPQAEWAERNQFDIRNEMTFNEMALDRVRSSIESGLSDLRYGDLSGAELAFSFASSKLRSLARLSPTSFYETPPSRECEAGLSNYDAVVFSPGLEGALWSITRTISDIDLKVSQDDEIEDRYFDYLQSDAMAVSSSFNRLVQSHGSAAQDILMACGFARF